MMKKLLFSSLLILFGLLVHAQSAGDYRSVPSVDDPLEWQDNATWEKYDGSIWTAATDFPATGGADITYTVEITSGSDVIFGMTVAYTLTVGDAVQPGAIIIQNGGVLTVFMSSPDEFIIADAGIVAVSGSLHCTTDILNSGDLIVNGTYTNTTP